MTRCPDCDHRWTPATKPSHCPACGVVLASQLQLLEAPAEIVQAMRARFVVWSDRDAFETWLIGKVDQVMKGMCCSECGTLGDLDDEPRGRPMKCIVCASGFGPASDKPKARRVRLPKSQTRKNMELLDG